jgi:hypothetical protein
MSVQGVARRVEKDAAENIKGDHLAKPVGQVTEQRVFIPM